MAEKKSDLLEKAAKLGLSLDAKSKVVEIKQAISEAENNKKEADPPQDSSFDSPDPAEPKAQLAKKGKRSKKGVEEAEKKQAKLVRQEKSASEADQEPIEKRGPAPKTRPKIERKGKKYRDAAKTIDRTKHYSLEEACNLAQNSSTVKFDATLEIHINLGVDPKQADQNIRGTLVLPSGSGKTQRIAVFGSDEDAKAAKAAGADVAGSDDFLEQLKKEVLDFDVLIATPEVMSKLGQYAKLLGPKGLMPNPKSGTVTSDVAKAVKEAKAGRLEFRIDKQGAVHVGVGKVSFKPEALLANARAFTKAIQDARPASIKGIYIKSAYVTTTMGPSIHLDLKSL